MSGAARMVGTQPPVQVQRFLRSLSLSHGVPWSVLPAVREGANGASRRAFIRNPNTPRAGLSSSLRRAAISSPMPASTIRAEIERATLTLDKRPPEPAKAKPKQAPAHLKAVAVIRGEMRALEKLAATVDESFDAAIDCIERRPHAARVIVTGLGKSGHVGRKIAASLSSTGTAALFMHASEALHGDLGVVARGDVVILLSNSGETEEVLLVAEMVTRLGAKTIGMVAEKGSGLGRLCDVTLEVGRHEELDHNRVAPSASSTATMAMGDAIALVLSDRMGFSKEQFRMCHPGGQLGKKER